MTHALLSNRTLSLLEKVAMFGERRHEILAGNIANINTPNYRMRDLPVARFQEALQAAVAGAQSRSAGDSTVEVGPASVQRGGLEELFPPQLFQAREAPAGNLTFQDGNNRSIEQQVMELTKNTMMQNLVVELMRFQMNALQAVIDERP